MELRWWPVVVAGLVCLAVCVTLAALLPMPQVRRRLRPLAHVDRLTRLPEYVRVVRLQFWSMLGLVALLVILLLETLLASSRPAGFSFASRDADAAHAEDIMLCVGEPVTDPATAGFAMVVSGHSHRPRIHQQRGVLYVNPGSIGPRRFRLPISLAKVTFDWQEFKVRLIDFTE